MNLRRFNCPESAELRGLLEDHLQKIFATREISDYMLKVGGGMEAQILNSCAGNALELPPIKMAFHIWTAMEAADRYAVLAKFQSLYASSKPASPANRKTMLFCALFVQEFAAILAEAMEWPD